MIGILVIVMFLAAAGDSPTDFISLISDASGPALMAVIIVGALKRWWISGSEYRRVLAERDRFLELALRSQNTADKALSVAEKKVVHGPEEEG